MRIVPGAILTAVAFLAISVPALAFDSGGKATTSLPNTSNVHAGKGGEADFIYIPPPPPSGDHPLFHSQSFEYLPSSDTGKAGELVRPVSGAIPVSALTSLQERAQMRAMAMVGPTTRPTPTPTATPLPTPTLVPTPHTTSANTKPETRGYTAEPTQPPVVQGAIRWVTSEDIEDPRFYRGSFFYDAETGTILPQPERSVLASAPSSSSPVRSRQADVETRALSAGAPAARTDESSSFPRRGRAMYYNPGIMQTVLSFRLEVGHVALCQECVGYVALMRREDINRRVWLEWEDGVVEGPFLVIDTAAKQHVASLISRNWVVDVDYETALRRGMNRPLPVTVWASAPRNQPVRIADQDGQVFTFEASFPQ